MPNLAQQEQELINILQQLNEDDELSDVITELSGKTIQTHAEMLTLIFLLLLEHPKLLEASKSTNLRQIWQDSFASTDPRTFITFLDQFNPEIKDLFALFVNTTSNTLHNSNTSLKRN
jgi:hypothetical protein